MNIKGQDDVFTGKGGKRREVHMSREARERLTVRIVLVSVLMIICRSRAAHLPSVASCVLNASAVYLAGFRNFTRIAQGTSFATDIQRNGATTESQEMLGHSSAVITQRYLHGLTGDGSML